MQRSTQPAVLLLATAALVTSPAGAGETETGYGIGLVTGFDSNPLQVMADGPSGAYTQLRLNGGVTRYVGSGASSAFFLSGRATTRLDESQTADAGYGSGDLRAGVVLSPPFAGHRLVLSAGGRLSAYRGTFTDRATGEVYEASVDPPTDPPTTITIPDRLDYDATRVFVKLRWKQGPRWSAYIDTSLDLTDYVEDYRQETDLDPLDNRSLTVRPGANVRVGQSATLGLFIALTDLDYDDRPALDESGTAIPGTTRNYEYTQYGLTMKVQPGGPWKANLGLLAGGRDDTYAGYYDSASTTGFLAVDRKLGAKNRLLLYASIRDVEYDHATVTGDPADDELRGSEERRYAARFARTFGDRLRWYFEGGTQRTDSRDPVFAYDRDWVLTGIRYGR